MAQQSMDDLRSPPDPSLNMPNCSFCLPASQGVGGESTKYNQGDDGVNVGDLSAMDATEHESETETMKALMQEQKLTLLIDAAYTLTLRTS